MMEDDYLDHLPTPGFPFPPPNQAIFTHTPFSFFPFFFFLDVFQIPVPFLFFF